MEATQEHVDQWEEDQDGAQWGVETYMAFFFCF